VGVPSPLADIYGEKFHPFFLIPLVHPHERWGLRPAGSAPCGEEVEEYHLLTLKITEFHFFTGVITFQ